MALDEIAPTSGLLTTAFRRLASPLSGLETPGPLHARPGRRPAGPSRRLRRLRMSPAVFLAVLAMWGTAVVVVLAVALALRWIG